MISNLIARYEAVSLELQNAIQSENHEKMKKIDHRIVEIWDDIISFQPMDLNETIILAKFLITRLAGQEEPGENGQQVRDKLLQVIISTAADKTTGKK